MMRRASTLVGALVFAVSAGLAFIVIAMRTKSPRMLGVVRQFNRGFTNKLQLRAAGKPGAYASIVKHTGRTSGRDYETPVVPIATDEGFLIVLPYGPDSDWVKNVMAAGSAVLETEGKTYTVDRPEVIPLESVGDLFPANEQRTHRWFGVAHCLRVGRVDDEAVEPIDLR
jgi:deazaflavin-dependent oxidoreductase (nitroreductase family)